jgi:hypothetical protein
MKITKLVREEFAISTVDIFVPVRYEDEDIPFDAPLRTGNVWRATVDIATGVIANWPQGKTLDMHMKVCDEGSYFVRDYHHTVVHSREVDYIPSWIPGEYGDYIIMKIDENGHIEGWDAERFVQELQEDIDNRSREDD